MKKLIQSAFALSLTLFPLVGLTQTEAIDDFLGLENEVLPDLEGPQRFTPTELHENAEWKINEKEVVIDVEPRKGQNYSIIPWRNIDPEGFLNIDYWLNDRKLKDALPEWKVRLRNERHLNIVGKVLSCAGTCPGFRGTDKVNTEFLSRIAEGDEFRTEKDSFAWIYLMDGSLLRLGAESSVSFHEISISNTEIFYLIRLNQGHVYWHHRPKDAHVTDTAPETDSITLPLMVREANLQWYERKRFQAQTDREHRAEVLDLSALAIQDQVKKLNELKLANNEAHIPCRIMMVAPNVTVKGVDVSFNLIHVPGEKSWFRKQSGGEFSVELRGYNVTQTDVPRPEVWNEVETNGRTMTEAPPMGELDVAELLTKRIQTIELAREIWMEKFSVPMLKSVATPKELALNFGYGHWKEEDLAKRREFLSEYTRRVETTNLRSIENLLVRLETSGEGPRKVLAPALYEKALNHYLLGLKSRYTDKKMRLREMNELEYYVWLLKHGKI